MPTGDVLYRTSARVVLVNPHGHVLLFEINDPQNDNPRCWVTPGGGVEEGERIEDAALRELREETGLVIAEVALGPRLAVSRGPWNFRGQAVFSEDWYFGLRLPASFDPDDREWTELEREVHRGWRWWEPDELETTDEIVFPFPTGLAELVRQIHRDEPVSAPVELPWTTG